MYEFARNGFWHEFERMPLIIIIYSNLLYLITVVHRIGDKRIAESRTKKIDFCFVSLCRIVRELLSSKVLPQYQSWHNCVLRIVHSVKYTRDRMVKRSADICEGVDLRSIMYALLEA